MWATLRVWDFPLRAMQNCGLGKCCFSKSVIQTRQSPEPVFLARVWIYPAQNSYPQEIGRRARKAARVLQASLLFRMETPRGRMDIPGGAHRQCQSTAVGLCHEAFHPDVESTPRVFLGGDGVRKTRKLG